MARKSEVTSQVFPGDDLAEAAVRRAGLPIGNLTSQWFGGVYLTAFDHWVKETLRCPGYVRYVDDFLLFADDKAQLAEWRAAIVGQLLEHRLHLNERKSRSYPTKDGVTFLGQRIWPGQRRLCRQNVADARRRLRWNVRQYKSGNLSKDALLCRWNSWRGLAAQADCGPLIEKIKQELKVILGATGTRATVCCAAAIGTTTPTTRGAPIATTTTRTMPTTTLGSVV